MLWGIRSLIAWGILLSEIVKWFNRESYIDNDDRIELEIRDMDMFASGYIGSEIIHHTFQEDALTGSLIGEEHDWWI